MSTDERIRELCEELGEDFNELTEDDLLFVRRVAAAKEFLDEVGDAPLEAA